MTTRRLVPLAIAVLCAACSDRPPGLASSMETITARCGADDELSCVTPILYVADLEASLGYYRDRLGFTIEWRHGNPPDFAAISRGHAHFFLCERCQGSPGSWSMTFARDVDALHRELVDRGARIDRAPTDMPWGLRELHVSDPDGNVVRFGGPIPH